MGNLLEAENPFKYIDLDAESLYPFSDMEAKESEEVSGSVGETFEVDSSSGTTRAGDGTGIRYVGCDSLVMRESTV